MDCVIRDSSKIESLTCTYGLSQLISNPTIFSKTPQSAKLRN